MKPSLIRSLLFLAVVLASTGLLEQSAQAQAKAPVKAQPKAPTKAPVKAPTKAPASTFSRSASGIEYRIYRRTNGRYLLRTDVNPAGDPAYSSRVGKVLAAHLQYRTAKDSVLFNSRKELMGMPAQLPLVELKTRGGIEEAVTLLQTGDSAVFRFNIDSIFAKSFRQPVPPFMKKAGNTMTLLVKAQKLMTQEEAALDQQKMMDLAEKKAAAEAARLLAKDDAQIQAYLTKNNLKGQKTPGGTYYVITKPGTGPKPQSGQTVSVKYTGMLLDGKVFDSTEKQGGTPISFPIGAGQVIPGWDQGLIALNQGTQAILLIPSSLAYGPRSAGPDIPANAILRFDVELVEVK
ncbi:FKBP-type peptidyl-prolyl cis-trans isomerase [Hymenobacter tibetensis]|uniref:peptidylprolyl isomerase n=1 Tax=Hymenobacter tibetensis TaxID=497967 RepID=A0ABY4CZ99_9BACT|nr:FKBP-type peptidyl-prolyl cis-trans isomerase [Hymenobacter tibetensis]UOG75589.1 FKBP-type peptidyl-prolyl cis-trans isomerase [Hymenobacter tibetensis]